MTIELTEFPPILPPAETPAIDVDGVSKTFRLLHERQITVKQRLLRPSSLTRSNLFHALRDISFEVAEGECFGIVGRNGSGKSTLLRCIAGIFPPDAGQVVVRGRIAPFIELGVGFNPELSARENAALNLIMLGLSREEAERRVPSIVEFAELEQFVDQPLKTYSTGMTGRLGFAVTVHVKADVLLFDEVFAVGDLAFRERCVERFELLRDERKTVVLVTHDMSLVRRYCDRALLLDRGQIDMIGDPDAVADRYDTVCKRGHDAPRTTSKAPARKNIPAARRPLLGLEPRRLPALIHTLAVTDFRLKYVGTALNYVWAIARPLAMFGVLLLIFSQLGRFNRGITHYSTYLLTSVVLWTFFSQATAASVQSLVRRGTILRRLPLPHLAIPLSVVQSAVFDLALNFVAVLVFALAAGVRPQTGWLELPLLAAILVALTSGVSLLLSALYLRFRDIHQVWLVVSQAIFYLTPVFYVAATLPDGFRRLLLCVNPVATVLTETRHAFVDPTAPTAAAAVGGAPFLLLPLGVVAATLAAGVWVFRREAPRAAENL